MLAVGALDSGSYEAHEQLVDSRRVELKVLFENGLHSPVFVVLSHLSIELLLVLGSLLVL